MTPEQLCELRRVMANLNEFTISELYAIMAPVSRVEITEIVETFAREGLLELYKPPYRYRFVSVDAKIHLLDINIAQTRMMYRS